MDHSLTHSGYWRVLVLFILFLACFIYRVSILFSQPLKVVVVSS